MYYRRLTQGLNDKGTLVPVGKEYDYIKDPNKDYYLSIFYYNTDQYSKFKETGSVAGVTEVKTPFLTFDFDHDTDLEKSRQDTVALCSRLIAKGLTEDSFTICFSGRKGFSVEVLSNTLFSPSGFKNITDALTSDLITRDTKIVNPSRIFRVPQTRHPSSGLYKLPITLNQLSTLPIEQIKELAKDLGNAGPWYIDEHVLPESIVELKDKKVNDTYAEVTLSDDLDELDYGKKERTMPSCKYSILNGFFKQGNRNDCLTALAAHYKARGYPKEVTYNMLKGAARLQHQRHPDNSPMDKKEIWNTVIKSVYGPAWQGKTYSCSNHKFLKELCPKGPHSCESQRKKSKQLLTIDAVSSIFKHYAENIEKNTIKTGIKELDDNIRLQTKTHVVIAASAGVGKTSLILNILNNASRAGQKTLMGSMDMSDALIYQKLAHKVTGMNSDKLFKQYKEEPEFRTRVDGEIKKQFKNVLFDFNGGVTIDQLEARLRAAKEEHGENLRLAVYDYINLISGPFSDANANLAYIAPKLKDLANELDLLIISLAQIARAQGGPSTPLKSHRVAKGSSAIEESATVLFGMWRPGYNTDKDNFVTIAGLKTRMGKEFSCDLHWDGLTGGIRSLSGEEEDELAELLEKKDAENQPSSGFGTPRSSSAKMALASRLGGGF